MSKITVGFIKAAIIYLVIAMLLGLYMTGSGPIYPWRPIHVHLNLLGWVSMMIFGVSYHILPRFSGKVLWSEALAVWHFRLANIGLIGMVFGMLTGRWVLAIFAIVEGVSIVFFAANMFKTIKAAPSMPPKPSPAAPKPAPAPAPAPAPKPTPKPAATRTATKKKK